MEEKKESQVTACASFDATQIETQVVSALADRFLRGFEQTHDPDFDEDEDERPSYMRTHPSKSLAVSLREQVRKSIADEVSAAITNEVRAELRAQVKAALEAMAAGGMPRFNQYGEPMSPEPWPKVIGQALEGLTKSKDSYNRNSPELVTLARKVFEEAIGKTITAELDHVKKAIRQAVDEQLSGTVIKTLREAVGLR